MGMREDELTIADNLEPPTIDDVAREAGVSTATVSRCFNTPERVVEKTRVRVFKAVTELGYTPNFGARAMAAKRTNTVGAIIPTMENAIFARGLQAFQEELGRNGFTLLVASSSYQPELEENQIRTLLARGADALLLIGFDRTDEIYHFLAKQKIPTVVAWSYRRDHSVLSIGFDNRSAMKELADRVFALGHRNVAMISAPYEHNDRARERVEGTLEAAREVGLDPDTLKIIETPYSIENGANAMRSLMAEENRPTAVFCGNDVLAVGALGACKALGLSVPQDVSITGFDDIELAQIADPPLTTVHVPHRQMGRQAASMLVSAIRRSGKLESERLATELVIRQSLSSPDSS